MLVAHFNGQRIEADEAEKDPEYTCPNCRKIVVLKKGRIRTHHFAHKPPVNCAWGKGETHEHREAKKLFKETFIRRGLRAEVEYEVASLPDDRRADVVVWSPQGQAYAIELQHDHINYDNLEHRTQSYLNAGFRVIWVPFLRPKLWEEAEKLEPSEDGNYRISRFPARPLERWVHGYWFGKFWMYDPSTQAMWQAHMDKHQIYREPSEWYDQDGNYQTAGGDWYISRRWKELTLWGPFTLDQLKIRPMKRQASDMGNHRYPGGVIGRFLCT